MEDFMASSGKLSAEISVISFEYREILEAVELAEKGKIEAKEQYGRNIDAGSESGLKSCLKKIRDCNETIEGLPASRENFFGKLGGLEDRYRKIMRDAQQHVQEVQANLDRVTKDLKEAEGKSEKCRGVMSEINGLKNLIIESGKAKQVSEDDAQI